MSEKLEQIKTNWQYLHMNTSDGDWLIEQAEKVKMYEKALTKIATKKMSMYISSSHMNQDFIKAANDALEGGLTGD